MKKALTVVASIILWVVILLAAFFAFVTLATKDKTELKMVFGTAILRVKSDSMKPEFETNDWIVVKECDPTTLQVGDIITFSDIIVDDEGRFLDFNTHRIVAIDEVGGERQFTTKGDNPTTNTANDEGTVSAVEVQGKYSGKLVVLGKVLSLLSDPVGFLCCIVLPVFAFLVFQVYKLITIGGKYKKALAREAAEEAAQNLDPESASAQLAAKEAELEALRAQLAAKNEEQKSE